MDRLRKADVDTHDNEADFHTKVLPFDEKRSNFVREVLKIVMYVCKRHTEHHMCIF